MANRKAITKGLRFEIFKRDGFTCQYCGQQPPNTVLQVDHIFPVVEGGTNDLMNLITSCQECNIGKGKWPLNNPQRPDADLAWLEVQQELAELKRYQLAIQERLRLTNEIIESLQDVWQDYSGLDWAPANSLIRQLTAKYNYELVEQAFMDVGPKVAGGYIKGGDREWVKYLWGVLKTMDREARDV